MKKTSKPNTSPIEAEIENKISLAYLLSVAKNENLTIGQAYKQILNNTHSSKIKKVRSIKK